MVEGPIGPTLVDLAEDADLLVLGTSEHTGDVAWWSAR